MNSADSTYVFGVFRLDVAARALIKDGTRLPVGGRAFDVLVALVRRRGQLASKAELLDEVWPGIAVEENNLTTQVLNLRKLLGQHDPGTVYIGTDAGRGYRFLAPLHDPHAAVPDTDTALHAPAPAPEDLHNLPAEANSFVGRTLELAEIAERLRQRMLLTLVGSGGVGKTRCALRVARQAVGSFADGVWLLELAPLQPGGLVAEALCRLVGAPVTGDRAALDVAVAFLRHRALMLVLDNCEHVLAEAAALADALLKHCPGVQILATSREKLGIDGETVFRMPSLPLPPAGQALTADAALRFDAVRLFVDRACDAAGDYHLTDADAPSVATICRRLDGVAMATELAAARLRILKPPEIAARLEDVFRLLTGGSKAALPRQQTLRATIDWSYALLSPLEQALLRRLSVFIDGFTLEGAIAVCGHGEIDPFDVLDLLTALVDKSLVVADQAGAATRYRMLATTRHYACEKAQECGEAHGMPRLAAYLADFYGRAELTWPTTPTEPWLAEFGPEVENLRGAIDWAFGQSRLPQYRNEAGDPDLGIALVAAAGSIAEEMSLLADMKRWTAAAMPHVCETTPKARAGWVLYWATRHQSVFGVRELPALCRRAIRLFREAGDPVGLSCALRAAGIALARPGEAAGEAFEMLSEAVAVVRPLGPSKDLANALAHLGGLHYLNDDEEAARALSEEALALRRALGDQTGELVSYINLAEFACARGDTQGAIDYARRALRTARHCQVREVLATVLTNLANYLLVVNDVANAGAAALEALALHRALGNQDYAAVCLEHMALVLALSGMQDEAARLFGHTDAHFQRTGQMRDKPEQMRCDRLRAELAASLANRLPGLMGEGAGWGADRADAAAGIWRQAQAAPVKFALEAVP